MKYKHVSEGLPKIGGEYLCATWRRNGTNQFIYELLGFQPYEGGKDFFGKVIPANSFTWTDDDGYVYVRNFVAFWMEVPEVSEIQFLTFGGL